jgi:dihydroorotate dehydrogenase (fumarate)
MIIGLKLKPLFEIYEFDKISEILLRYKENVQFITCSNSIPNGLIIDGLKETTMIKPRDGLGGIGGICMKPTSLSNVWNLYKRLGTNIDIIGCGGITSGLDVFEYILCGAKAVQIGSQLIFEGPSCFKRIGLELEYIMTQKEYKSIDDFRGKLKLINL